MGLTRTGAAVLAFADAFVAARSVSDRQLRILRAALHGLREHALFDNGSATLPCLDLVPLVFASITGDETAAIPLAAATAFVYLGADILDDLADGDTRPHWAGYAHGEIALAGATCLASLPQALIGDLDVPPSVRDRLQTTLARGLMRMAAGQHDDLAFAGVAEVPSPDIERAVAGKTGEEFAVFCRLAAELAQVSEPLAESFSQIGQAIGIGGQLACDCHELFQDPAGRDFAAGNRTLPVALRLDRIAGIPRAEFLATLTQARTDESARQTIRATLRTGGELRRCAFAVEVHRQRALRLLAAANPREPMATGLRAIIDEISFFAGVPS